MSATTVSAPNTMVIGYMPMPPDFKYKELFLKGRPRHEKFDDFWCKHPPMDTTHRAKIFAPFDALAGFDEAIESKHVHYEKRRILSETEKAKVNRKLTSLLPLTRNGRAIRYYKPEVTVTYFCPCTDVNSEWYGSGGYYQTLTGTCEKIDDISQEIIVDGLTIPFDDITSVIRYLPAKQRE